MKPDLSIMQLIIAEAERDQTPFGAAIALGDQVFTTAVAKNLNDPAGHAVMQVLQNLSDLTGKKHFTGFTLYSTCEPCTLCIRAAIRKKVDTVFFGCPGKFLSGFLDQVHFAGPDEKGTSSIEIQGGIMEKQCRNLIENHSV